MTDTQIDTATWGAISWRQAHRLDKPAVRAAGYKVNVVFAKPQTKRDVETYISIHSNRQDWISAYTFEVVPFDEQVTARDAKLAELTRRTQPRERLGVGAWKGD